MARKKKNRPSGSGSGRGAQQGRGHTPGPTPEGPPAPRDGQRPPSDGNREERLITRRDMAGWVGGTPAVERAGRWPGERLGLAQDGPASMAGWGRRVLALIIDWFLAAIISAAWFQGHSLATLAVFFGMHVLLVGLLGTTIGKRIARIQVVRVGGAPAGLLKALLRTVLLCLVVPPLVLDADGRGLHDRVARTVQIRM